MTDPQASPPHQPAPAGTPERPPVPTPETAPAEAPPPPSVRDVEYKGAPLDAAKGPGLGCFWLQLGALGLLVVVTPLSVAWGWPDLVSGALLIATLILLLFAGQTVIFLLRLVAADRRAELRRVPLASRTPTVGQIEDEGPVRDGEPRDGPPRERGPSGGPSGPSGPSDGSSSREPGDRGSAVPE